MELDFLESVNRSGKGIVSNSIDLAAASSGGASSKLTTIVLFSGKMWEIFTFSPLRLCAFAKSSSSFSFCKDIPRRRITFLESSNGMLSLLSIAYFFSEICPFVVLVVALTPVGGVKIVAEALTLLVGFMLEETVVALIRELFIAPWMVAVVVTVVDEVVGALRMVVTTVPLIGTAADLEMEAKTGVVERIGVEDVKRSGTEKFCADGNSLGPA